MRFEFSFDQFDVRRAQQVLVTPAVIRMAGATFKGVRAAFTYWMFYLRPVLQGLIHQTPRDWSPLSLFYRVVEYIGSIWRWMAPHMFSQSLARRDRFSN